MIERYKMDTNFKNNNYQNYPKNCTECKKCKSCKSWYGGTTCTEAPITIFGTQENRKKIYNAEKI